MKELLTNEIAKLLRFADMERRTLDEWLVGELELTDEQIVEWYRLLRRVHEATLYVPRNPKEL